jgi:hypothetical protein
MTFLLIGFITLFMQVPGGLPINPGPPPGLPSRTTTTTTTAPAPEGPRSQSTTNGSGNTTVVIMPAADEEIAHDATVAAPPAMDSGATAVEKGLNTLARQSLQLPQHLLSRDKNVILDTPAVRTLNDSIRYVGLAVWVICMALIIMKHLAGPFTGVEVMDLSVALPIGVFMGALGWFNHTLLALIIDLAGAFLTSVVNAPLSDAITRGLSLDTGSSLIVAPVIAIFYDLLAIWLIFKLWLQIAWLWILGAGAPIYITATGAPFLGKFGSHWWRNWFGTLIDPILVIIGLHLTIPWFDLLQGAPPLAAQLAKAMTMLVILSTVGWHVGAYRPQGVDALLAVAFWRMLKSGGHHSSTPATTAQALPPAQPPSNPHGLSGMGYGGTGSGNASTHWKTHEWAVGVGNRLVPERA